MPYRFLEEIATSDVAFEAWGKTIEEMFTSAADAEMNVMVEDLSAIKGKEEVSLELENSELDMLLFNFLNEFIYYKDAKRLLLRVGSIEIDKKDSKIVLRTKTYGEGIDPKRHPLKADVKAVTLHMFEVKETKEGWKTTVVLDI